MTLLYVILLSSKLCLIPEDPVEEHQWNSQRLISIGHSVLEYINHPSLKPLVLPFQIPVVEKVSNQVSERRVYWQRILLIEIIW